MCISVCVCVFGILNVGYLTLYVCIHIYIYAILGMPWGNVLHSYAAWSMCCSMKNTLLRWWWKTVAMLHYWTVGYGRFVGYDLGY